MLSSAVGIAGSIALFNVRDVYPTLCGADDRRKREKNGHTG
jgi:hypothetical protein